MIKGRKPKGKWQTLIMLLVFIVMILALLVTDRFMNLRIAMETKKNEMKKATQIAKIVANNPIVIEKLDKKTNKDTIKKAVEEIRRAAKVDFIVVMDMNEMRESHPNVDMSGKDAAGKSRVADEKYFIAEKNTLDDSLHSFFPVFNKKNRQIGVVEVGVSLEKMNNSLKYSRFMVNMSSVLGLLVGLAGALFLAKRMNNRLFGLEESEIAKLLEERRAMLQSTKEGIAVIDSNGFITLVNNETIRLFQAAGFNDTLIGKKLVHFIPGIALDKYQFNQEQELNGIPVLMNQAPIMVKGIMVGELLTLRDKTEIKRLSEQLTGAKVYAEALRTQSHEFMNKLHAITGLIQMENYKALPSYLEGIVDYQHNELKFVFHRFKDPVLAGFMLGKLTRARELKVEFIVNGEGIIPESEDQAVIHEVITILGNLIDNGLEAVQNCLRKSITLRFDYFENILVFEVHDTGKGLDKGLKEKIFAKGFSTKGENRGFGLFLVKQSVEKVKGEIEIITKETEGTAFIVTIPYQGKKRVKDMQLCK